MAIPFNQIPANLRVPGTYAEIDNSNALQRLPQLETKMLVIGQRLSGGSVAEGVVTPVSSVNQGIDYFGRGSNLAHMIEVIKENNRYVELFAVALDDASGASKAGGTIVVTGSSPTENGTLHLYIAGRYVPVAVTSTMTAAAIATAIAAKITELADLPVTAAVDGSTDTQVNVTSRHGGTIANQIDMRINYLGGAGGQKTPAGVSITITAQLSGGATDPDVADAISGLPDVIYDYVINAYTDATNMGKLETELDDRWYYDRALMGHMFSAKDDTQANLTTYGNARNNEHSSVMGVNNSPLPAYEWAAAFGAVVGYHATIDPARPFQTLELKPANGNAMAPVSSDRFTYTERNTLLYDGIATHTIDSDGTCRIERAITTYQTNGQGAADASYLDVNSLLTLSYIRQVVVARLRLKYPRHKLAASGTRFGAGQPVMTPNIMKAELVAIYGELEELGLVENMSQFKTELIVEINASDPNRLDVLMPPDLMNQLRLTALNIQFLL